MKKQVVDSNQQYSFKSAKFEKKRLPDDSVIQYLTPYPFNREIDSKENQDNIKISIRIQPLSIKEDNRDGSTEESLIQLTKKGELLLYNPSRDGVKTFNFDSVLTESATQEDVFRKHAVPLLKQCLSGENVAFFTYGQSGTEKTYTMGLISNFAIRSLGLIPRALKYLFDYFTKTETEHPTSYQWNISLSLMQIYLEDVFDLLNPGSQVLGIREDPETKEACFPGLISVNVKDLNQTIQLINAGWAARVMASQLSCIKTANLYHNFVIKGLNENSSTSHIVLLLQISQVIKEAGKIKKTVKSKLTFVDLAGSELISKTTPIDSKLDETKSINASLKALGNVISALRSPTKNQSIPYRASQLTRVLQKSLNNETKILLIANVSGHPNNFKETLSTLLFAQRCKDIVENPSLSSNTTKSTPNSKVINKDKAEKYIKSMQMETLEVSKLTKEFYRKEQDYKNQAKQCENEIQVLRQSCAQMRHLLQNQRFFGIDVLANLEKSEYLYKLLRSFRNFTLEKIEENATFRESLLEELESEKNLNFKEVHAALESISRATYYSIQRFIDLGLDEQLPRTLYNIRQDLEENESIAMSSLTEAVESIQKVSKLLMDSIQNLTVNSENAEKLKVFLVAQRETIAAMNREAIEKKQQFEEVLAHMIKYHLDLEWNNIKLKNPTLDQQSLSILFEQKENEVEAFLRKLIVPNSRKTVSNFITESSSLKKIHEAIQVNQGIQIGETSIPENVDKERVKFSFAKNNGNFGRRETFSPNIEINSAQIEIDSLQKKMQEVEGNMYVEDKRKNRFNKSGGDESVYKKKGSFIFHNLSKETAGSSDEDVTKPLAEYSIISPRYSDIRNNENTKQNRAMSLEQFYYQEADHNISSFVFQSADVTITEFKQSFKQEETKFAEDELSFRDERLSQSDNSNSHKKDEIVQNELNTRNGDASETATKIVEKDEIMFFNPQSSYFRGFVRSDLSHATEREKSGGFPQEILSDEEEVTKSGERYKQASEIQQDRNSRAFNSQRGFFGIGLEQVIQKFNQKPADEDDQQEDEQMSQNQEENLQGNIIDGNEVIGMLLDSNKDNSSQQEQTMRLQFDQNDSKLITVDGLKSMKIDLGIMNDQSKLENFGDTLEASTISRQESNISEARLPRRKRKEKKHLTDYSQFNGEQVDIIKAIESFDIQTYEDEETINHKKKSGLRKEYVNQAKRGNFRERKKSIFERDGDLSLPPDYCNKIYKSHKKREKSPLEVKELNDDVVNLKDKPLISKIYFVKEEKEESNADKNLILTNDFPNKKHRGATLSPIFKIMQI